jgi:ABC-type lipoprotein release transport system permease subunit
MFITMTAMMQGFTDKFIIETVESSGHITVHDEPRETETKILEKVYTDPNACIAMEGIKPRDRSRRSRTHRPHRDAAAHAACRRRRADRHGDAIATYGTKTYGFRSSAVDPAQQTVVTTIG